MGLSYEKFSDADDYFHRVSDSFYETETFWFSFFVPERNLGGWIYTTVRQNAGVSGGGLWMWDHTATNAWDIPFFENFSALKVPSVDGATIKSPTGAVISVVDPGMVYDLRYDDRDRVQVELTFRGLETPVPLRSGAPPYPSASHYDQTGRVTGTVVLDGEPIDVDCYAMRDRSWGPRTERGYTRVGYTWLAGPDTSLLTFSAPTAATDDIHSGYLRTGAKVRSLVSGHRKVRRDPTNAWVEGLDIAAVDENGTEFTATATACSRFILPGATSVCINTLLEFDVDGRILYGEDQDVWPISGFRRARAGGTEFQNCESRP